MGDNVRDTERVSIPVDSLKELCAVLHAAQQFRIVIDGNSADSLWSRRAWTALVDALDRAYPSAVEVVDDPVVEDESVPRKQFRRAPQGIDQRMFAQAEELIRQMTPVVETAVKWRTCHVRGEDEKDWLHTLFVVVGKYLDEQEAPASLSEVKRLREGIRAWLDADRSGDLPGQSQHYFEQLLADSEASDG